VPARIPVTSLQSIDSAVRREELVKAMGSLPSEEDGSWLSEENPFLIGGSDELVRNFKDGSVDYNDASEYIAASAIVHCADAWSYLGRAVDALLKGDINASVHLTYYSELRSAKSILATDGIFVGNRLSLALAENAELVCVSNETTHEAVWTLIQHWFSQNHSVELLSNVITPEDAPLETWISQIPAGVNAVIEDMLVGISFDLGSFVTDRKRRNLASYEATSLSPSTLTVSTIRKAIVDLWNGVEPGSGKAFPGIDRAILAYILSRQFSAQHSPTDLDAFRKKGDWSEWSAWIESLTPPEAISSEFLEILRNDPTSDEYLAIQGSAFVDTSAVMDPSDFIGSMFARAMVLARIATGLCLSVLESSGKSQDDYRAWVEKFAINRGHITADFELESFKDLFEDIGGPRDKLDQSKAQTLHGLVADLKEGTSVLGQVERVVTWTFA